MLVDAECHECCRALPEHSCLPPWQDIVLLENVAIDFASMRVGSRRDPRIKMQIIHIGYTGDWYVHA